MKKQASNNEGGISAVIALGAVLIVIVIAGLLMTTMNPVSGPVSDNLQKFKSYDEIVAAFTSAQSSGGYYRGGILGVMNAVAPAMADAKAESTAGAGSTATDYSKTNVQVEGVDEADIVKNDGKYIYAISNGKVFLVDAFPAGEAKIISTIDLNGPNPVEMFLSSDSSKLLLFTNNGGYYYPLYYASDMMVKRAPAEADAAIMPAPVRNWGSSVVVYDITDKSNPIKEKQVDFEGSYLNSRLIGDNAYFVINSYPHYPILYSNPQPANATTDENNIIPIMAVDGEEQRIAMPTEIGIMPEVDAESFVTIASINLESLELKKETVVGAASSIYSSTDNLFLANTTYEYPKQDVVTQTADAVSERVIGMPISYVSPIESTAVSKFHLDNGAVTFVGQGKVPGRILNQFSMDEYNSNFRIATTVEKSAVGPRGEWESETKNNVFILNADMNIVGSIEDIAPNETIYSARFMGDKGYLVTFKRVDPLFVLDLSDATNPKILGKLKIPGYSDYLHPIDETHLLGIGKEVDESIDAEKVHTPGAVYYTAILGVKMAIFDVSDVEHPVEMYKHVVGGRGTDSEALTEHKAILFNKEKNLLVLPITIVENAGAGEAYGEQTFQGAVVMNVNLEDGFSERGKISHVTEGDELKRGYFYDYASQIRRSLFMDNVLYTFSEKKLKANALDTLDNISEVEFPQPENNYYNYYGGVAEPLMVE